MKKILLSIFTILAIGVSVNAQTKIFDFPFDNSLSATLGTGTFVSSGTSFTTDRHGNANNSLSLTNAALASLSNLPIGNNERTVSLWFKVLNAPSGAANIARYGVFSGAGVFGVYTNSSSSLLFQSGAGNFSLTNPPQPNTWNHLLYSLSNDTVVSLYMNGILNTTVNTTINTLLGSFQLGENGFTVVIDDLKIYSGTLNASQVTEVYTNNDLITTVINTVTKIYDFPFDNSLSATVGTGTFVSSGTSFTTDRNGNANNSLSLTNAALASLSNLPIGNNDRTVSLWFKVPNAPSSASNIARYGVFSGAGVFGFYTNSASSLLFQSGAGNFSLTNPPQTNTWNHLLFSLSNDTVVSLYMNGILNNTVNTNINTLLGDFQLGENGFTVEIDDLKIYEGTLTASQVTEVYTNNNLIITAINDVVNENNLSIYPNPTSTITTLSGLTNGQTLKIIDIMCKVVYQTIVNNTTIELDVAAFANGIYIIQVEQNGAIAQKKLVVSK
jgi:hypothetical protein